MNFSNYKYLSVLVIIFTLGAGLFFAGIILNEESTGDNNNANLTPTSSTNSPTPTKSPTSLPSPTAQPTYTPSPTPTISPTFTFTPTPTNSPTPTLTHVENPNNAANYKFYSANEFSTITNDHNKPNLTPINTPPSITGNHTVDQRIISIAKQEGYVLQATPQNGLQRISGELFQKIAQRDWRAMRYAASKEGFSLDMVSGFRTFQRSRELFNKRFTNNTMNKVGHKFSNQEIVSGKANEVIRQTLRHTAPPGFSKHHTGYAVDLRDANSGLPYTSFGRTRAYQWLSKNNFLNAKRFGFVPSYPFGASNIGPDPEAWEYVWVGKQKLENN